MLEITSENGCAVLGLYHTTINSLGANIPLQSRSVKMLKSASEYARK